MTINQKQPPTNQVDKLQKKPEVAFRQPGAGIPAFGCFKLEPVGTVVMFFSTKERGLRILKDAVGRGTVSADDAPKLDLKIMGSILPYKESDAERHFEFKSRDGENGALLFLKVNGQITAIATRLDTAQKMSEQITSWIESYSIPSAKVEEVKMNFYTSNRTPPPEPNSDSLPFVVDTDV